MVVVPEQTGSPLLAADEPAPVELIEFDGKRPLVLACDHASNRVPKSLDGMGLNGSSLGDHIAWDIIDAQRAAMGLAPVGSSGLLGVVDPENPEGFDMRQPQHVALAGALGFGVFDREQIDHREVRLA